MAGQTETGMIRLSDLVVPCVLVLGAYVVQRWSPNLASISSGVAVGWTLNVMIHGALEMWRGRL